MNGKGMIAILDAVIFIAILAFISVTMLTFGGMTEEDRAPDASEVCDRLLSTEMGGYGLLPEMGNAPYTMADVAAYAVASGDEDLKGIIKTMADDLTFNRSRYRLELTYNGDTVVIGQDVSVCDSSYTGTVRVMGGGVLHVDLRLA
ncbi:MAG: hypothetical protein ACI4Q9_02175 [Candidatus Methanomethylophilaceae archaeon]